MIRDITIIHPSRGRPELCYDTAKLFLENSSQDSINYFVSIDENDPKKDFYINSKPDIVNLIVGETTSCIESLNFAAEKVNFSDVLIVVSDDFICQKGWDKKVRETIQDKKDFVLKTSDGVEPWIVTFPIIDRVYYNKFGYVYNPQYKHLFCDTEMTHIAEITGKLIENKNIVFEHLATRATHDDEVNKKNNSTWWQGESTYLQRVKENFNLKEEEIIKKVSHSSHIEWLACKGIKV